MSALSASDSSGEFADFTSVGEQGNDEKSPSLLLSDTERVREALLASRIAVEHIRVVAPSDSRATASYAAQVVVNRPEFRAASFLVRKDAIMPKHYDAE